MQGARHAFADLLSASVVPQTGEPPVHAFAVTLKESSPIRMTFSGSTRQMREGDGS
jgi:hypothetical protein